jgi:hypothetical protein
MNLEEFKLLCGNRLGECTALMFGPKNDEYSRNNDKLHNFKVAADMLGVSPEQALVGMWVKHLVSVLDIVRDVSAGKPVPLDSILNEKFNDTINYTLMLEALLRDRTQNKA